MVDRLSATNVATQLHRGGGEQRPPVAVVSSAYAFQVERGA